MLWNDAEETPNLAFLACAFAHLPISVLVVTPASKLLYANTCALELLNVKKEELLAADLALFSGRFSSPVLSGVYQQLLGEQKETVVVTSDLSRKDGAKLTCDFRISLLQDTKAPQLLVCLTCDKEEDRLKKDNVRLEQKVVEKTEALATIFERITDGFTAYDKDWNYTYVNQKAAEIVNRKPEELIGKNVWQEFPELVGTSLYHTYQKAMNEQVVTRKEEYVALFHKWFEGVVYPSPQGLSVFFQDITERKMAQQALQEKEVLFRTIVETTQEGIWQIDADNCTTFVNDYLPALFGYSKEEMLGRSFLDFMADDAKTVALALVEERKRGIAQQHEFTFLRKDGTPLHTLLQASPVIRNGRYTGSIAMMLDNTKRKRAEEKLIENEKRFRALFEYSQDGIALLSAEGIFIDVSPSTETILGFAAEHLIGTNTIHYIVAEDVPLIKAVFDDILKKPLKTNIAECRVVTKNKNQKWLECTFSNLLQEPAIKAVVINFRDITERKNTENKLRESEAKYRKAQSQGKLGHWEWDFTTNELTWSDEIYTMFGLNPETHTPDYRNFLECIYPEDRKLVETTITEANLTANDYEITYRIVLEDQSIRCVYMLADLVRDSSGELIKAVGMVQDVTAQKLTEQKLSLSEQNYRLLFEKSPVPFWMVEYPSFRFIEANQAATDLYGYSREEFLSMTVRDIRAENDNAYFANANLVRKDGLQQSIARHKKKNGDLITVQLTTDRIVYNGDKVWLASTRDITQEMEYEKQLEKKEKQLELIFNSAVNGKALFKVEKGEYFRYEAVNNALCKGIRQKREDLVGRRLDEVFTEKEIEHLLPQYRKAVATGNVQSFTANSTQRLGSRIVEYTAIPIKNDSGEVVQLLSVSHDITAKKKAEDNLLKKNIELRQLSIDLENIREEERTRMAREVHDELGQQLTALKMEVSWLHRNLQAQDNDIRTKINSSLHLIHETINSVRKIATQLRPSILDDLGLAEALSWQASEFSNLSGVPVLFQSNVKEEKVAPAVATAVFRVFQEALTNVARHAKATAVSCSLDIKDAVLYLTVSDNGTGFAYPPAPGNKTLGLIGMKERVEMLQGRFALESDAGQGTTITVEIPL